MITCSFIKWKTVIQASLTFKLGHALCKQFSYFNNTVGACKISISLATKNSYSPINYVVTFTIQTEICCCTPNELVARGIGMAWSLY